MTRVTDVTDRVRRCPDVPAAPFTGQEQQEQLMSTAFPPTGQSPNPQGPPPRGTGHRTGRAATDVWVDEQESPDFQELRRRVRGFVFPATVAFLAWYLLYVLMSAYARGFMAQKLLGNINVAYVFGLLQFVSTFLIALLYARHADRKFDPLAAKLRDEIEERTR